MRGGVRCCTKLSLSRIAMFRCNGRTLTSWNYTFTQALKHETRIRSYPAFLWFIFCPLRNRAVTVTAPFNNLGSTIFSLTLIANSYRAPQLRKQPGVTEKRATWATKGYFAQELPKRLRIIQNKSWESTETFCVQELATHISHGLRNWPSTAIDWRKQGIPSALPYGTRTCHT